MPRLLRNQRCLTLRSSNVFVCRRSCALKGVLLSSPFRAVSSRIFTTQCSKFDGLQKLGMNDESRGATKTTRRRRRIATTTTNRENDDAIEWRGAPPPPLTLSFMVLRGVLYGVEVLYSIPNAFVAAVVAASGRNCDERDLSTYLTL